MSDWRLGWRAVFGRIGLRLSAVVALLLAVLTGVATALERSSGRAFALDRALLSWVLGLALPIVCLLIVQRSYLAPGLLARFGYNRRQLLLGGFTAQLTLACLAALWMVGIAAAVSGVTWVEPLLRAAPSAVLPALLGATAYVSLFLLCSRVGVWTSWLCLIVDWGLGLSSGVLGALVPRAHIRSLAGGGSVLDWSYLDSSLSLFALALCLLGWAIARCRA